jgi:hypothetical protein
MRRRPRDHLLHGARPSQIEIEKEGQRDQADPRGLLHPSGEAGHTASCRMPRAAVATFTGSVSSDPGMRT